MLQYLQQKGDLIFPLLPNKAGLGISPLQILLLIKYIRPDALNFYLKGFIGEAKAKFYYFI
jgi:hypothetical protein